MPNIYITRKIPDAGLKLLKDKKFNLDVSPLERPLSKPELVSELKRKEYDGVLCLLTDAIDKEAFDAAPRAKIFANYAVGHNNIDIAEAKKRGITVTNTPGALTEAVAEHTIALTLAIARRVAESDKFVRDGKFDGWGPELFLGEELAGKTLGLVGAGRIGSRVGEIASKGLRMKVIYHDVKRSEEFEKISDASFIGSPEEVLRQADVVSIHVPLLPSTKHLIDEKKIGMMKKSAYLINTSRGAVIDERALVSALEKGEIAGAALDVFEDEPRLTEGLASLPNVVLTPHTASATRQARDEMAILAANNIIAFFDGRVPPNKVA